MRTEFGSRTQLLVVRGCSVGKTKARDPSPSLFEFSSTNGSEGALPPAHDLRARLKSIHNYIYANDRFKQHAKVFEELMKLLLAKIYDERRGQCEFWLNDDENAEACGARIRRLFQVAAANGNKAGVFAKAETLELSARTIAYAVRQLQNVSLAETDAKGTAFQAILGAHIRGQKGQFFTPDPVKRLLLAITDPEQSETILDPACGSAGLLVGAIEHIRTKAKTENPARCAIEHVLGIEVDPILVRVARLNMMVHGEGRNRIFSCDALSPMVNLSAASGGTLTENAVDVVITNPPFGTKGKVDDPKVLAGFPKLAGSRDRQVPDILFLERILQLLKPGGRAGVVLPFGDLANSSLSYVREYLRTAGQIYAVVSLPPPAFKPAENSVKAAVLFIRKWPKNGGIKRYPAFRAISRKIGYDMHERPTYLRDSSGMYLDKEGKLLPPARAKNSEWLAAHGVVDEDLNDIIRDWTGFRTEYKRYLW